MLLSIFDDVYNNDLPAGFGEDTRRIFFDYFQKSQQVILSIIFKVLISSYNTNNILNRDLMFTKRFEVQANDAYIIMKTLINNIDDKLNYNLKDYIGEIGYVAYNLLPSALSFENYRIGIYSDLSLMHANTIIVFMKNHFSSHYCEVYNPDNDYDFVLTTDTSIKHNDATIVAITDLQGQSDIDTIYTALYASK